MTDKIRNMDWNKASELGLIEKINRELLHPLGLALCRETETGVSPGLLISPDGEWCYDKNMENNAPSDDEVRAAVKEINDQLNSKE